MPKVSIILPTYNGAQFIERAIRSVLMQEFTDWELLIIDDGSTSLATGGSIDDTQTIVQRFIQKDNRVRYLRNERNLGIQKTLNRGLSEAKGELVARIDDDDVWAAPDKLKQQVDFLAQHPDYVVVGTGLVCRNESDAELFRFFNPLTDADIRARLLYRNCISHSTVLFRKASALACGGYSESESARHVEDYDLWLKMGLVGKLANLPIYAVAYMLRDNAISGKNKTAQFRNQLQITQPYKGRYPSYGWLRMKSYIRLWLYTLGGAFVPKSIRYWVMRRYKRA